MRQVTQLAVSQWLMRKKFRRGNTHTDGNTLYLHNNAIAKIDDNDGLVYVRSAGWETNTTRERLNGIPGVRIHQKNWEWYLNNCLWTHSHIWTPIGKYSSQNGGMVIY